MNADQWSHSYEDSSFPSRLALFDVSDVKLLFDVTPNLDLSLFVGFTAFLDVTLFLHITFFLRFTF